MAYFERDRIPFDGNLTDFMRNEYAQKTRDNDQIGLGSFQEGKTSAFPGYTAANSRLIINIGLLFTPESRTGIIVRVADPIKRLAEIHNVPILVTGEDQASDLAPHSVVAAWKINNLDSEAVNNVQRIITSSDLRTLPFFPNAREMTNALVGKDINYRDLVVAPAGYIASGFTEPQDIIFKTRIAGQALVTAAVRQVLEDGWQRFPPPYSYYNISHVSVFRINGPADPNNLLRFRGDVCDQIGEALRNDPIKATVEKVHIGSALDFQMALGPQQVDKN